MALVAVRACPHNPSASAAPSPRDRISRQAEQRCCRPGERCDYHRFAGLVPVALVRDAPPGRAVHPLAAAPRCLRGPLTDLPSTWHVPGTDAGGRSDIEVTCALRPKTGDPENPAPGLGSRGGRFAWSEEPGSLNWLAGSVNGGSCRRGDRPRTPTLLYKLRRRY
jgi:hypothetical protein